MTTLDDATQRELARQQALVARFMNAPSSTAVLPLRETAERAERGLEAYRANAQALADRALTAAFGTVQALVGADNFAHLAAEFWRAHPPLQGDMGEWGTDFPGWLEAHPAMQPWPYLGDSARLDWALHRNERAADALLDGQSLLALQAGDPSRLYLKLMPGTTLLRSSWPIAAIHRAHQLAPEVADAAFEAVRQALACPHDEQLLVVREGWRATVHVLSEPQASWVSALLQGLSLQAALAAAGDDFDFAAWLATALRHAWISGFKLIDAG